MAADQPMIPTWVLTFLGFFTIFAAMIGFQWRARSPDARLPRAGDCFGHLMRPPLGRVVFVVSWWWIGWHFLAR
jgi:uncharacterized membrane protein (DUF106 family)